MKKLHFFLILLCLIFCISGCSAQTEPATISFSEYYQGIDEFEEIRPYLEQYFLCVQSAYEDSDKKDIDSFELSDEYENARDTLRSFCELHSKKLDDIVGIKDDAERAAAEKAYLSELDLLHPYIQVESMMAEQRLMAVSYRHMENPDWFEELDTLIEDSLAEYSTETGE